MTTSDHSSEIEQSAPQVRWAMGHAVSHLRLWLLAVVGLAADLWTKDWAFSSLLPGESRVLIKNLCSLQLSLNPGALFGIGAGMAPIFVGASVLALLFVLYLFANSTVHQRWTHIALGLVLAGAMGNLYDRTFEEAYVANIQGRGRDIGVLLNESEKRVTLGDWPSGENERTWDRPTDSASGIQPVVRDFIRIEAKIGSFSLWPWIFNVADALLVIGVAILMLQFWFDRGRQACKRGTDPDRQDTDPLCSTGMSPKR